MIMRVFYDGDTYIALPGGFKMLDYLVRSSEELQMEIDCQNSSLLCHRTRFSGEVGS